MEIAVSEQNGTKIVTISGRIEHTGSRKLQETLRSVVVGDNPNIAADLSQVTYLDSSALGVFVSALKSARSRGGDLRLAGLADIVMNGFRITRLSTIFQIHRTIAEAVASFSEG